VAYNLAITLSGNERAIGWVGFGPSERGSGSGTYGVGYLLESTHWRQGYMTEVLRTVTDVVFNQLGGIRLVAWCHAGNVASARTLEKAGFSRMHTYSRTLPGEEVVECVDYELVANQPGDEMLR
jgi:RimJ/RimL family protein N-acetyltransferase